MHYEHLAMTAESRSEILTRVLVTMARISLALAIIVVVQSAALIYLWVKLGRQTRKPAVSTKEKAGSMFADL
jgi:hypothetical protein